MSHEKKTPVWMIRPKEGGAWLIETSLTNVAELLDTESSVGSEFTLKRGEMTATELANMGEFDGW